jgi:hypothetical protein
MAKILGLLGVIEDYHKFKSYMRMRRRRRPTAVVVTKMVTYSPRLSESNALPGKGDSMSLT